MPLRVLVTGAGGFSGAHIVRCLLEAGHCVTAQVRSSIGRLRPQSADAERLDVVAGDLAGDISLPERVDVVVHAAARSQVPPVPVDVLLRDNVLATRSIVEYAVRVGARKLIYLSSLSVYGRIADRTVDEHTPIIDPGDYGLTKLLGERLLAGRAHDVPAMSIRLPGVIGPGSLRNWLTTVMQKARAGSEVVIFNPGAPFNNAVHVEDLAAFVCTLVDRDWTGAQTVTVGAGGETTVRQAVQLLIDAFSGRSSLRVVPHEKHSFLVSSDSAITRFGYAPMEIKEMLRRFAADNARH